jgi:predicted nucleic acid-binding protein
MKIIVAVDANIILSALLGGKPSTILFDYRFNFITTKFTINEVEKYIPKLEKKLNISQKEIILLLDALPLKTYSKEFYKDRIEQSKNMIFHIDKKDVEILALALKFQTYLWSQDKHFDKSGYTKILKTCNFINN